MGMGIRKTEGVFSMPESYYSQELKNNSPSVHAEALVEHFRELTRTESYSEVILSLLSVFPAPLSITQISHITGLSRPRVCKVLHSLARHNLARRTNEGFYKVIKREING